jgi:hypothetical protein
MAVAEIVAEDPLDKSGASQTTENTDIRATPVAANQSRGTGSLSLSGRGLLREEVVAHPLRRTPSLPDAEKPKEATLS